MKGQPTGTDDVADDLDDVWKALASHIRRRMLDLLAGGAMTTGDLANEFTDLSRFAVMQHLKVLERADLVVARKQGRSRYNHLNPVPIQQVSDRWISRYHRPMTEALVDLKLTLESKDATQQAARSDHSTTQAQGASA